MSSDENLHARILSLEERLLGMEAFIDDMNRLLPAAINTPHSLRPTYLWDHLDSSSTVNLCGQKSPTITPAESTDYAHDEDRKILQRIGALENEVKILKSHILERKDAELKISDVKNDGGTNTVRNNVNLPGDLSIDSGPMKEAQCNEQEEWEIKSCRQYKANRKLYDKQKLLSIKQESIDSIDRAQGKKGRQKGTEPVASESKRKAMSKFRKERRSQSLGGSPREQSKTAYDRKSKRKSCTRSMSGADPEDSEAYRNVVEQIAGLLFDDEKSEDTTNRSEVHYGLLVQFPSEKDR